MFRAFRFVQARLLMLVDQHSNIWRCRMTTSSLFVLSDQLLVSLSTVKHSPRANRGGQKEPSRPCIQSCHIFTLSCSNANWIVFKGSCTKIKGGPWGRARIGGISEYCGGGTLLLWDDTLEMSKCSLINRFSGLLCDVLGIMLLHSLEYISSQNSIARFSYDSIPEYWMKKIWTHTWCSHLFFVYFLSLPELLRVFPAALLAVHLPRPEADWARGLLLLPAQGHAGGHNVDLRHRRSILREEGGAQRPVLQLPGVYNRKTSLFRKMFISCYAFFQKQFFNIYFCFTFFYFLPRCNQGKLALGGKHILGSES